VENRYVVYICVCVYIYNGAAIWVAFNCNSYQMHLNIDLDMDTQDDFKYAVSVLQDNLQDYDICRSKLVTRHISSPKKMLQPPFYSCHTV
jgi:spore coat polysaccharide biosynthesis protein SpsF (cytidylyltransferase family)